MKTKPYILKVKDPYRKNKMTTLGQFARNEGVPRYTAVNYFYKHGRTLEGFRTRRGTPNAVTSHTYTYKGKFVDLTTATRIIKGSCHTLAKFHKRGITDLETIIKERSVPPCVKNAQKFETDDGRFISITDFAKEKNISRNPVACFVRDHKTLKGFDLRKHSRIRPKIYHCQEMGISLTSKEWAKRLNLSVSSIKQYAYNHGGSLDGIFRHMRQPRLNICYNGMTHTVREWAKVFNTSYWKVYSYYHRHGSLEGFNPDSKRGQWLRDLITKSKAVA